MLAHGVLSNHTSNHTSTQSLGISLHESSFRMERSGGFSAFESKLVGEREREMKEGVYILPPPESDRCVFFGGARIIRGVDRMN